LVLEILNLFSKFYNSIEILQVPYTAHDIIFSKYHSLKVLVILNFDQKYYNKEYDTFYQYKNSNTIKYLILHSYLTDPYFSDKYINLLLESLPLLQKVYLQLSMKKSKRLQPIILNFLNKSARKFEIEFIDKDVDLINFCRNLL